MNEVRFISDAHLGKLARYLRLCGFDTLYDASLDDREIIKIASSGKRIVLSCDKDLIRNLNGTPGLRIVSRKPVEQIGEVLRSFDIAGLFRPFTRCMGCNGLLDDIGKEEILDQLPARTRDYYSVFRKCRRCGQLYWEGSHYEKMKKFVDDLKNINC